MKKIFKILLVLLIAINFVFSNQVKIKASYTRPNWYTYFKLENGKIYDNDWVPGNSDTVAWGQDLRNDQQSAVVLYKFGIACNVQPGQTLKLNIDLLISGIRLNQYNTRVMMRDTNYKEIEIMNLSQLNFENDSSGRNFGVWGTIEYENLSSSTFYILWLEINVLEGSNLTYVLTTINDLTLNVTPDMNQIQQDTNEKVGGIFETVKNIFTGITNLPKNIASSVSGFFTNVVNSVTNIGNQITNMVSNIKNWLIDLLNGILDGLKSLFIPSDDYFKNYFDSLYDFFSEKLGILIMPIDILTSLFENISNLDNGDGYIHVPPFEFMGVNLIPKIDYNLKVDVEEVLGNYYDMYYLLTDVIIYFMLFNMAKKNLKV